MVTGNNCLLMYTRCMSADGHCALVLQDINSQSWMVRMYYKHRLFMGACCISCEVLYLSVRRTPGAPQWRTSPRRLATKYTRSRKSRCSAYTVTYQTY